MHIHCVHILATSFATDIAGKKKAIQLYLDRIKNGVEKIYDHHMLDHVLALLMQADASCKVLDDRNNNIKEFERKDIFAPAQKNETQLRFKKTCGNPGRKKKHTPFRLSFLFDIWIIIYLLLMLSL